jgi:hypothetical protein
VKHRDLTTRDGTPAKAVNGYPIRANRSG